MNQKLLTIGVVAVMIAAAIGYVALLPGGDGGGGGDGDITATIYIESVDSGEIWLADVDIGPANAGEMAMMSLFGGIRQVDFKPLIIPGDGDVSSPPVETTPIYKDAAYRVYCNVDFKVSGSNIVSLTKATIEFSGTAGTLSTGATPDHVNDPSAKLFASSASTDRYTITKTTGLTLGTSIKADNSAAKWDKVNGGSGALTGDRVDGTLLNVYVTVEGVDDGGNKKISHGSAGMKLTLPSYKTSSLSVLVTSISGGI